MEIDRQKVTPLLLRCFWRAKRGNTISEYRQTINDIYPDQEVQIYTWPDATLMEIGELIKDVVEISRGNDTTLLFSLIFTDKDTGNLNIRQVGQISSSRSGIHDRKTLADIHFETGDFLDIAIQKVRQTGYNQQPRKL